MNNQFTPKQVDILLGVLTFSEDWIDQLYDWFSLEYKPDEIDNALKTLVNFLKDKQEEIK